MTCHVHRNRCAGISAAIAAAGGASWSQIWDQDWTAETPVDLTAKADPYTLDDGVELALEASFATFGTAEINALDGILLEHDGSGGVLTARVGVDLVQLLSVLSLPAYLPRTDAFFFVHDVTVVNPLGGGSPPDSAALVDLDVVRTVTERVRWRHNRDNNGTLNVQMNATYLDADPSRSVVGPTGTEGAKRIAYLMVGRTIQASWEVGHAGSISPATPMANFFAGLSSGWFNPRVDDDEGAQDDPTEINSRYSVTPSTNTVCSIAVSRTRIYRWA